MARSAIKNGLRYTYEDYCSWDDGQRWELLNGVPYLMSSAPNDRHQRTSTELVRQLANFLFGKRCQVFHAPFDVRLNAEAGDDTVVQPDVLVNCHPEKIVGGSLKGAPDLVIEILSPATAGYDRVEKLAKYQEAGVPECWIVDPQDCFVHAYILENGKYVLQIWPGKARASLTVLPGCVIDLADVFAPAPGDEETQEQS
ncbi:MAG: Uma2 family endonuclease [Peptococcaceae bacterium]|jgi:Uma2 family endonuclease|nr:Uma2 family endonuclease [Peptococcaceae bacterium]